MNTRTIEIFDDGTHELDKKRVATLKEAAKSYNLEYSLHAPFADINIASPSKTMLNASMKRLKQSMAYANAMDAKVWVFHPGAKTGIGQFYPGADWKQNNQSITRTLQDSGRIRLKHCFGEFARKILFFHE